MKSKAIKSLMGVSRLSLAILICLFSSPLYSKDRCPSSEDHSLSAVRYQLYTAFHMGFDGYEAPCDMKCMGKESCKQSCQSKKGLELLSKKMSKMYKEKQLNSCQSYTSVCIEQCHQLGDKCESVCRPQHKI